MANGWIIPDFNNEHTLPKDGERVLVVKRKYDGTSFVDIITARWRMKKTYVGMLNVFSWGLSDYETRIDDIKITHWQPLPALPNTEERTECYDEPVFDNF